MSCSGHGGNMEREDLFIFVPIDINTNLVLVIKFANIFLFLRGTGFQTCLTHVHVLDISKLFANYFSTILDVTALR